MLGKVLLILHSSPIDHAYQTQIMKIVKPKSTSIVGVRLIEASTPRHSRLEKKVLCKIEMRLSIAVLDN